MVGLTGRVMGHPGVADLTHLLAKCDSLTDYIKEKATRVKRKADPRYAD